ncbi:hypothetical protein TR13x_10445, partial [Caloranaerobacter sp. TR13]|uniref:hypothetical protein n=1 Tax=Caloranaerobacter sp. TR13 TaxID=1302151 RepID=UPI0006D9A30F
DTREPSPCVLKAFGFSYGVKKAVSKASSKIGVKALVKAGIKEAIGGPVAYATDIYRFARGFIRGYSRYGK